MRMKLFVASLAGLVVLAVGSVRASDPIGFYCVVNKVVFEPNETEPAAVQLWGAFSFAVVGNSVTPRFTGLSFNEVYGPVQTGYMYFTCAKAGDTRCLNEWIDLKGAAGSGKVIGLGARYAATNGRLRPPTEKPANPDTYPLNFGLVYQFVGRIGMRPAETRYGDMATELREAAAKLATPR